MAKAFSIIWLNKFMSREILNGGVSTRKYDHEIHVSLLLNLDIHIQLNSQRFHNNFFCESTTAYLATTCYNVLSSTG